VGFFDFLKSPDYLEGSREITRDELIGVLYDALPMSGEFRPKHLKRLFKDMTYIALREDRAERWIEKVHETIGKYSYIKQSCDCDDFVGLSQADRIKGRVDHGFPYQEAAGWLDYFSRALEGYHEDEWWVVVGKDGKLKVRIRSCQIGTWRECEPEVVGCDLFGS